MIDIAEVERLRKRLADQAFSNWLEQPTVRFMISMIPPSDRPEVLQTLLRDGFNSGVAVGGAAMASEIIQHYMKSNSSVTK
jgi:hypothetical protein